jgi:putative membrane protein
LFAWYLESSESCRTVKRIGGHWNVVAHRYAAVLNFTQNKNMRKRRKIKSDTPSRDELAARHSETLDKGTRWAADRTLWAADRTQIAWLRTAISLIGFGFAIGKSGDVLESQGMAVDSYHGLQFVGLAMISLAVLGLFGAVVQNMRIDKRLNEEGYGRVEPVPLGLTMSVLVLLVGIAGGFIIFI